MTAPSGECIQGTWFLRLTASSIAVGSIIPWLVKDLMELDSTRYENHIVKQLSPCWSKDLVLSDTQNGDRSRKWMQALNGGGRCMEFNARTLPHNVARGYTMVLLHNGR